MDGDITDVAGSCGAAAGYTPGLALEKKPPDLGTDLGKTHRAMAVDPDFQ